mgnify:CR=1 FL=1
MSQSMKRTGENFYSEFAAALVDPNASLPASLPHSATGRHEDAAARFAVYRNNVAFGLRQVLRDKFPLLRQLLGEEAFESLMGYYLDAEMPSSPLLSEFGATLAHFLDTSSAFESLAFVGDVARLEWAMQQAFYAPEHEPMATERLTALAPDDLVNLRLRFAPCVHILTSPWPIFELWEYLSEEAAAPDFDSVGGQTVMIYRHDYTAQVALLTPEQHRFLTFLADQRSIGDAMIEAHLSLSDFDTIFIHLLEHKLIVSQ